MFCFYSFGSSWYNNDNDDDGNGNDDDDDGNDVDDVDEDDGNDDDISFPLSNWNVSFQTETLDGKMGLLVLYLLLPIVDFGNLFEENLKTTVQGIYLLGKWSVFLKMQNRLYSNFDRLKLS